MNARFVRGKPFHPGFIGQNTAAAPVAAGIDCQDRHLQTFFNQEHSQAFDEGTFPDTGNAGDSQADRFTGMRQEPLQNGLGLLLMTRKRAFDEGDGLGQDPAVPLEQGAEGGFNDRGHPFFFSRALSV